MIIQLTSISKLRVDLLPMCVHVVLGRGLKEDQQVLLTHGDTITNVAPGFHVIAKSGQIVAGR